MFAPAANARRPMLLLPVLLLTSASSPDRRVLDAAGVVSESTSQPVAVLSLPVVLCRERLKPIGCVAVAGGVVYERVNTVGRVVLA